MNRKTERIYFVGIKGIAMAALAVYWKERGAVVVGSDTDESFPSDMVLERAGIAVLQGFHKENISKNHPEKLVYTGAHDGRNNPEVLAAAAAGIPCLPHGRALGEVMAGKRQVSVAGSHGKTTTTAMIATILASAGRDPSYAIGCGEVFGLGQPGHAGHGDIFVAEADEYVTDPGHDNTPRFLWQRPDVLVVTNIDFDHPDVYASLDSVKDAFFSLTDTQADGSLVVINADDPNSRALRAVRNREVLSYGMSPKADLTVTHVGFGSERTFVSFSFRGTSVGEFTLRVPGRHNALNAAAASLACHGLGLSWDEIRKGVARFHGTKRRFEKVGQSGSITVYDDYAHHPNEIRATLSGARDWYPKRRLIAVFQPHTYSRTKSLLTDFAGAFHDAGLVIISEIYASARETETLGITSKHLVAAISERQNPVYYAAGQTDVSALLARHLKPDDVIILMGAGNIYTWKEKILSGIGA